jgi:hypothetical protein
METLVRFLAAHRRRGVSERTLIEGQWADGSLQAPEPLDGIVRPGK